MSRNNKPVSVEINDLGDNLSEVKVNKVRLGTIDESTSPLKTMQFSSMKTTYPICVRCFCSTLMGRIAPLGQTSPQTVQSKLQNPFSKLTVGCIMPAKPYSIKAGFRT